MQRAVVSTASYAARRFGIHSGMPLRVAYRRCPQAVFLPVDFPLYARISRQMHSILRRFSRRIESAGLDEAFIDATHVPQSPELLAQEIKNAVGAETALTCSVGIGPNKLLAKIASDLEKPDGLTRLDFDDIPRRVWPLPVTRLWGVGPRTKTRLGHFDVQTIGELAQLPLSALIEAFGDAHGRYLYDAARGIDNSPVIRHHRRKSVGQQTTFQHDVTNPDVLLQTLAMLTRQAVARCRQYHYRARTVTVKLRYANFETHAKSVALDEAVDRFDVVLDAANRCLQRHDVSRPVRLLGVSLNRLEAYTAKTE